MQEVLVQADKLVDIMKKSSAYTQYHTLYQEIKADEELFHRLSEYRRSKFQLQLTEDGNLIGRMEELSRQYQDILSKENVKNFLSAELRYCRMIRLLKEKVLSAADMDLDFLEG